MYRYRFAVHANPPGAPSAKRQAKIPSETIAIRIEVCVSSVLDFLRGRLLLVGNRLKSDSAEIQRNGARVSTRRPRIAKHQPDNLENLESLFLVPPPAGRKADPRSLCWGPADLRHPGVTPCTSWGWFTTAPIRRSSGHPGGGDPRTNWIWWPVFTKQTVLRGRTSKRRVA